MTTDEYFHNFRENVDYFISASKFIEYSSQYQTYESIFNWHPS